MATYLIVSTVIVGSGLIYLFNPFIKSADAAWMNDDWGYRQEVPATSTNGSAQSTVFISFTLDTATLITAGKLQSSCQDIRVTDISGNLLPYHIGRTNACNASNTTIDFLLSSFPDLKSTYYVYYGNPSALSADAGAFSQSQASNYSIGTLGTEAKASSPKLYWKFDDATGTTAYDSTTNALNGTLNNSPTWQTEDKCISGKCLWFDGATNMNVSRADNNLLDFAAADNFTVQAWIKRNGASSAVNYVMTKASGATYTGYKVYMDASGDFCFDTRDGTNAADSACTSAIDFDDDVWHMVTGVKTGTTKIELFVDGNLRATDSSIASTGTLANSGTFYAGVDQDGTSNEWLGFIDEAKVYAEAKSAAQVKSDFSGRGTNEGVSERAGTAVNNRPGSLNNGLVGYWRMDESSWNGTSGEVKDTSGNSFNGTAGGGATTAIGKFNSAGNFDGTNDIVTVTDTAALRLATYTFSFWMNSTSAPSSSRDTPFSKYQNYTFDWGEPDSNLQQACVHKDSGDNDQASKLTSTLTSGTWYFITCEYDGTNLKAYLNGNLETSNVRNAPKNGATFDLLIGDKGADSSYFPGKVDEARVYNRALSDSEIKNLYNFAPGPVGRWDLEEGSGTSAFDTSGSANTGTITAGTGGYTNGKFGKAYNFDAADTVINAGSGTSLDNLPASGMSLGAWVYPKSAGENSAGFIMAKNVGTSPSAGWILQLSSTRQLTFTVDGSTDLVRTTTDTLTASSWSHVSVTWDGVITTATSVHIYINGVEAAYTTSTNGAARVDDASSTFFIGNDSTSARTFDGYIDQVRAFNYALTQGQAVADMNAGHPAPGSPVGSAYGYWKFDEGTGATTYNSGSGGSTIDGTLTSAARTTGGKYGQAITFSANTNNISIGDEAGTDGVSQATWSFWTKPGTLSTDACIWCKVNTPTATPAQSSWAIMTDSSDSSIIRAKIANAANDVSQYGSTPTGALVNGTWAYITVVYDGTQVNASRLQIYVNGRPVTTTITGTIPTTIRDSTANAVWGRASSSTAAPYNGTIDEAKLYLSALTTQQAVLDMNRGQAQQLGALSDKSGNQVQSADNEYCIPGDTTTCTAPVGRWDFEEGSGTASNDTSTNANNCDNSASYDGTIGKLGKAYNVVNEGTSCGTGASVTGFSTGATGLTAEAWIYPKSEGQFGIGEIISKTPAWLFRFGPSATNALDFSAGYGTTDLERTSSDNAITLNKWQHVVVTWTGSKTSTTAHLYVNGQEVSYQVSTTGVGSADSDTGALQIGNLFGGGGLFDGKIDQVRLFNYARTAAQVAWDYNKGAPLTYWKMDECSGTTIHDYSVNGAGTGSNGQDGTWTGTGGGTQTSVGTCSTSSTAWGNGVTGKRNYSLNFDGTDDKVSVTDSNTLDLTSDFTISAWVSRAGGSGAQIISKTNDSSDGGYAMLMGSSGELYCRTNNGTTSANSISVTGVIPADSTWHLATIVRSGTSCTTYIDGINRTTTSATHTTLTANANNLIIGTRPNAGGEFWNGKIDDVRIYNYALTAKQVQMIITEGANRYGPTTGAP